MELPDVDRLELLPRDAILEIGKTLSLGEIVKLCQTSKKLNATFCGNPRFWKPKLEKEFPYWPIGKDESKYFPLYKYLAIRKTWFSRNGEEGRNDFVYTNPEMIELEKRHNAPGTKAATVKKIQRMIDAKADQLFEEYDELQERDAELMQEAKKQLRSWGNLYIIDIAPEASETIFWDLRWVLYSENVFKVLAKNFKDKLPPTLGDADFIVIYRSGFAIPMIEYYVYTDETGTLQTDGFFNGDAENGDARAKFEVPAIMYSLEGNIDYIKDKYGLE